MAAIAALPHLVLHGPPVGGPFGHWQRVHSPSPSQLCAASAAGAVLLGVGKRLARTPGPVLRKRQNVRAVGAVRAGQGVEAVRAEDWPGLPPFYCDVCRLTCTSEKSLQQHLRSKRHLKNMRRQQLGAPPPMKLRKKKAKNSPEAMAKKAWRRLIRSENFEKLFAEAFKDPAFPHGRLVELLKLVAAKGGAAELADVLQLVTKGEDEEKLGLKDFHQILDLLLARVPTPRAMVRVLLNLAVRRPEDVVPLVPPTIGFGRGRHNEMEEREELFKLFEGCQAVGESTDALDAFRALKKVEIEELINRVEIPTAEFSDYYPHFLILLVLDFLEELVQNQVALARMPESLMASGRLVPEMATEISINGKSLVCSKVGPYKFGGDQSVGQGVLLCTAGSDPLQGGALAYGRIEMVMEDSQGVRLILNVGGKNQVQNLDKKRSLDVYGSVNLVAFERQFEALKKIATAAGAKRFPLWELLPLSGVGGDILDSWAARMRNAVNGSKGPKGRPQVADEQAASEKPEVSRGVLKLRALAKQGPVISPKGRLLLKDFSDFLEGDEVDLDPDISESVSRLNDSQQQAVQAALAQQLTVIQGPPGTGKTHVSVEILKMWAQMGVKPVLVTSHNNIAVDNIAEKAYAAGLRVVRLAKGDRVSQELDECTLNSLIEEQYPNLDYGDKTARYEACQNIIDAADVVCVTTISSASNLVSGNNRKYGAILMDEAAQTTELSALVPIANVHARRLVLVGDHCQLPATALSLEAETRGLTLSLFQRLVSRGFPSFFLDTQFRMHPCIAEHSSMEFYGGKLRTGVKPQSRLPPQGFDWPIEGQGVALLDTQRLPGRAEARDRASWCNPAEASVLSEVLRCVLKTGELELSQVGVVTPYMGQVRRLRRALRQHLGVENFRELLVASVDSFQGREKELILFSAVRSNPRRGVGFLADWRRLNVMITRARRGLVIIGDARTLSADPAWAAYIQWARTNGYMRQV